MSIKAATVVAILGIVSSFILYQLLRFEVITIDASSDQHDQSMTYLGLMADGLFMGGLLVFFFALFFKQK